MLNHVDVCELCVVNDFPQLCCTCSSNQVSMPTWADERKLLCNCIPTHLFVPTTPMGIWLMQVPLGSTVYNRWLTVRSGIV